MEQQKQTTFLGWLKEKIQAFFASISMLVAKTLLGKKLFEEEYHKLSMKDDAKQLFNEKEKEQEIKEKNEERGKSAENREKDAKTEKKISDPKELMNLKLSFQELVQAEDEQLLSDLTKYMESKNLNIVQSAYSADITGSSIQFKIMDKDGETHDFSIYETGNSKDLELSKFIEAYCIAHNISVFQTQEKQFDTLIKMIQQAELDHSEHSMDYWNHSFQITSENGKTKVLFEDKEIFSGQMDLTRFFADESRIAKESDEKLIDLNRHVLNNMMEAIYQTELKSLGYDIEEEKEQIQLEDVVKMETSFQDKMKAQDLTFLNTLREGLCKETGLDITTSYVLPPKSLDMHGKESLLQINIGSDSGEKHIMIDEYGCVVKNEMQNEEILNAIQHICIENDIGLLPDIKDFSDCLFEEAKYDVVIGNEHSSLNFLGNEINIQYENRQNEVSIHCNGEQLFRGDLENLLDKSVVEDIYAGVYEKSLSYIGYDVLEESYEESCELPYDQQSFTQYEIEAAQEDFLMEQQRLLEEEQAEIAFQDHSECCQSHEEENYLWEENYQDR